MPKYSLHFNYKPLLASSSLVVANDMPTRQDFNADTGIWLPDYTSTPLVLAPKVSLVDKDTDREVANESSLVDIHWEFRVGNGDWEVVTPQTDGFSVSDSGADIGSIVVSRNSSPDLPLTLRFSGKVADPRQGGVAQQFEQTLTIHCSASTQFPTLTLDKPETVFYDPLGSETEMSVNAAFAILGVPVDPSLYLLKWEVSNHPALGWHEVGSDVLDYYVSASGASATVSLPKMGWGCGLRVTAAYDPYGSPVFNASSPTAECWLVRMMPKVDFEIANACASLPQGTSVIQPKAVAIRRGQVLPDPSLYFDIKWRMATYTAGGSTGASTVVGYGNSPQISTEKVSKTYGASLDFEATDKGPLLAWADSDGKVLTDGGAILLIK